MFRNCGRAGSAAGEGQGDAEAGVVVGKVDGGVVQPRDGGDET